MAFTGVQVTVSLVNSLELFYSNNLNRAIVLMVSIFYLISRCSSLFFRLLGNVSMVLAGDLISPFNTSKTLHCILAVLYFAVVWMV